MNPAERVRAYYNDLSSGDAAAVAQHFTEDAIHYYTRRAPHLGAAQIAENAAAAVEHLGAVWVLETLVADDEQAAIEWSMAFNHPTKGRRMLDRGAELFRFRDGLICEIRAYYNERGGDLVGFDHAGRGHAVLS
ncbi:MAG: nuclear transport factor 2 family protein [Solirubrobacteraceae bacterium]